MALKEDTKRLLSDAAEYLSQYPERHITGEYFENEEIEENCRVCAIGACAYLFWKSPERYPKILRLDFKTLAGQIEETLLQVFGSSVNPTSMNVDAEIISESDKGCQEAIDVLSKYASKL